MASGAASPASPAASTIQSNLWTNGRRWQCILFILAAWQCLCLLLQRLSSAGNAAVLHYLSQAVRSRLQRYPQQLNGSCHSCSICYSNSSVPVPALRRRRNVSFILLGAIVGQRSGCFAQDFSSIFQSSYAITSIGQNLVRSVLPREDWKWRKGTFKFFKLSQCRLAKYISWCPASWTTIDVDWRITIIRSTRIPLCRARKTWKVV